MSLPARKTATVNDAPSETWTPGFVSGPNADEINKWVKETWENVGDLRDFNLFPTDVLVAHFERTKLPGSTLFAARQTKTEDRFQGKVGLILKLGTQAYVDAIDAKFHGFSPRAGDWAVYKNTDGREMDIVAAGKVTKTLVRVLKDGEIYLTVNRPDRVW